MEKLDFSKDRRNFCKIPARLTRIINNKYKGHVGILRTDLMTGADENKGDKKHLRVKDCNGNTLFELNDVEVFSVDDSEASLTVKVEIDEEPVFVAE